MPSGAGGGTAARSQAPTTLLAFDFGTRRIGVAIGNDLTGSARALATIDTPVNDRRFAAIEALIREWQPDRLVVGLPTDEDGSETDRTRRATRFANQLRGRFGLPVEMVDERFSSREAQAIIASAGGDPDDDDGIAAEVILRQYLDGLRRRDADGPATTGANH
jgi:putative holliday junction resolvase